MKTRRRMRPLALGLLLAVLGTAACGNGADPEEDLPEPGEVVEEAAEALDDLEGKAEELIEDPEENG